MARNTDRSPSRRAPKDAGRRIKKKPCALCRDKIDWVDYKDVPMLRKYMSDRGKIRARRVTGNCAQHQREIALAIKTARELVLLPYTQRTVMERSGGRGRGRGERPGGPGRHGPRPPGADAADGEGALESEAATDVTDDAVDATAEDTAGANGDGAATDETASEPVEVGASSDGSD
jgi:small subunit ribosomal protein S18